jgi:hypothetical protein
MMNKIHANEFKSIVMAKFPRPQMDWIRKGKLAFVLDHVWINWLDEMGRQWRLHIIPLFLCDGASAPWFAQWYMPVWGPSIYGWLPHDLLFRTRGGSLFTEQNKGALTCDGAPATMSRLAADQVMRAGFALELGERKARIAFRLVHLFGKRHCGGKVPALKNKEAPSYEAAVAKVRARS